MLTFTSDTAQQVASFFSDTPTKNLIAAIYQKLLNGSICLPAEGYNKEIENNVLIGSETDIEKILIQHNNNIYIQKYFVYETAILQSIQSLVHAEKDVLDKRYQFLKKNQSFIENLFPDVDTQINWQAIATVGSFLHSFSIIAGGPGTGKTTTVSNLLALLLQENSNTHIALAAPTGKAAARLYESLQSSISKNILLKPVANAVKQVSTIHRLLGYIPKKLYFNHNQKNPLPYDVVIIDESSMLDVTLFAKLITAVKKDSRIIFLGDKDQLAAVEAGSIFSDIYNTVPTNQFNEKFSAQLQALSIKNPNKPVTSSNLLSNHIITLQESRRYQKDDAIGIVSEAVLTNQVTTLQEVTENKFSNIEFDNNYEQAKILRFANQFKNYIQEPDIIQALKLLNNQTVLCAVKEGAHGTYETNKVIERHLQKSNLISVDNIFYENRPIILTQNYNDLEVYNGEVGLIRKDSTSGIIYAWFLKDDQTLRKIIPGYLMQAETAFAITIHKSQGSEYNAVHIILPEHSQSPIVNRELLYTAITRAKKNVSIQSSNNVFMDAASKIVTRASGITERLKLISA